MILRWSRRPDPRLVLGSVLALMLPFGTDLGANLPALAQAPLAPAPSAPPPSNADALRQQDQQLDAARARQRETADSQAKLRRQIEALSADRRKLNQQLIDTAARVREVEASIDATRARLVPLDEQETL